ncbi:methyltransferase [Paenibacillus sp. NPDC057934]|uniref:methyltransferase n=1 Tax=Paenibacillus sp. NPDC057934 TaxID=3346282 RepID=UPI0036DC7248
MENVKEKEASLNPGIPPQAVVMGSISGFFGSFVIKTAVDVGIFKALKNGIATNEALSDALGLDSKSLFRLMRALISMELVSLLPSGEYSSTVLGQTLEPGPTPQSIEPIAEYLLSDFIVEAMAKLKGSIQTGKPSFDNSAWFMEGEVNIEQQQIVNRAMEVYSKVSLPAILRNYSFEPFDVIVDVAGGLGQILAGILHTNPKAKGVLYDLPTTVEKAKGYMESVGLSERCELIAGDMFKSIPAGGDLYIISKALNDWDDEHVLSTLRNVCTVMSENSKLMIIEMLIDDQQPAADEAIRDLFFLAITPGGRIRTKQEFTRLIEQSGMKVSRIIPASDQFCMIECERVE